MLSKSVSLFRFSRFAPLCRCFADNPIGVKEDDIGKFMSELESFTKETVKSRPKDDLFKNLSEEEISSALDKEFNQLIKSQASNPVSKEEEKSFFDGVLKMHPSRKGSDESLISKFKKMIQQVDPEIPFYYDYKREDYSNYEGKRRMTIGVCGEPKVGKSSLIQAVIDQPIEIQGIKRDFNQCLIQGVRTMNNTQFLFYDMPNIMALKSTFLPEPDSSSLIQMPVSKLDAFVAVLDASKPLTTFHREMLYKLSEISFYHHSLFYIDLNKVDLVEPKPRLLVYSDAISEVIFDKREQLVSTSKNPTKDQIAWANEDLFMTSAIEKDGTEDWITGFYKVAKPGEWASMNDFVPSLCSKEEVSDVINDKIKKLSVPKVSFDMKTLSIREGENGVTVEGVIHMNNERTKKETDAIKQKLEKAVRKELSQRMSRKVDVCISVY